MPDTLAELLQCLIILAGIAGACNATDLISAKDAYQRLRAANYWTEKQCSILTDTGLTPKQLLQAATKLSRK